MKKLLPVVIVTMSLCFVLCACSYLGLTSEPETDLDVILVEEAEEMAKPVDSRKPGSLLSFYYRYGESANVFDEYEIKLVDGDVYFSAKTSDGVDVEGEVSDSMLEDIVSLFHYNDIFEWNEFHSTDEGAGYHFEITAQFRNGLFSASGYEEKPENYRQGHAALKNYLERKLEDVIEEAAKNAAENE